MDLETAKLILSDCVRSELRDHAFGDMEVFWYKGQNSIAEGYFGGGHASVSLGPTAAFNFKGEDAHVLKECGTLTHVERNDETGPDKFELGATMPGLTKEAVRKEITR